MYKYVKGKGWLPIPKVQTTTDEDGNTFYLDELAEYPTYSGNVYENQRVRLIDRPPRVGEYGWAVASFERHDGTLNWTSIFWDVTRGGYRDYYGWICRSCSHLSPGMRYITVETLPR